MWRIITGPWRNQYTPNTTDRVIGQGRTLETAMIDAEARIESLEGKAYICAVYIDEHRPPDFFKPLALNDRVEQVAKSRWSFGAFTPCSNMLIEEVNWTISRWTGILRVKYCLEPDVFRTLYGEFKAKKRRNENENH